MRFPSGAGPGARELAELCRWAAGLEIAAIPERVLAHAALVLCDDLAAMLSARADPLLSKLREQALRGGSAGGATIFDGSARRSERYTAAFVNGAAAPWNELDEGSRVAPCHAGIYALPALLAEAESENLSTGDVLRALVISYETVTRFALAFPQPALKLHPHALFGAVGAASAVAAARRFDANTMRDALTLAATLVSPGPFEHAVRGSFARNMWVAQAAVAGLRAADWAACGAAGLADGPHAVFAGVFGVESNLPRLVEGLGSDWLIRKNFQKIYPCCQYAHSTIEAMAELLPRLPAGMRLDGCEEIAIDIHEKGLLLNECQPATILAARFSVPHIAAVMAVHGRVDTATLDATSLDDPRVAAARRKVALRLFEPVMAPPHDRPARATLRFADGVEYRAECLCARGSPSKPFSTEVICAKVSALCAAVCPGIGGLMDRLLALDGATLTTTWPETVSALSRRRPA